MSALKKVVAKTFPQIFIGDETIIGFVGEVEVIFNVRGDVLWAKVVGDGKMIIAHAKKGESVATVCGARL